MYASIVIALINALGIYLLIGLLFAVPFILRGIGKIDSNAVEGSWGFRLLVLPGCIALWPLLLRRWIKASGTPPDECSPHIQCSQGKRS